MIKEEILFTKAELEREFSERAIPFIMKELSRSILVEVPSVNTKFTIRWFVGIGVNRRILVELGEIPEPTPSEDFPDFLVSLQRFISLLLDGVSIGSDPTSP